MKKRTYLISLSLAAGLALSQLTGCASSGPEETTAAESFAGIFERFTDQELAVNWESGKIAGQAQVKTTESGGRLASWSWGSTRYTVYTASAISDEECTQVVTNLMELSYYE